MIKKIDNFILNIDYFALMNKTHNMAATKRKGDGFVGEKIIVIPEKIVHVCQKLPIISNVFITRMGLYPKALNHYYQRPKGIFKTIIIYCTDGEGWIKMNNKKTVIQAGEYVIIKAGLSHSYGSEKNNPWTIYWFHLQEKIADTLINALSGQDAKPICKVAYSEDRIQLFENIYSVFTRGYSNDLLIFANISFSYFFASLIMPQNFDQGIKLYSSVTVSEKAIGFMKENIRTPVSLNQIAEHCGLSVSFFSRKFKQETGYPPIEYLNYLKIQKACQLLHFSKLKINELIEEIGITDAFYFSRLFKRQMGVSPMQYRKNENN